MSKKPKPVLIDLFCGAGGLSEGLRKAGFEAKVGVDFDKHALATYAQNHPGAIPVLSDIARVTGSELCRMAGSEEIDLIAGGPSCQGFSTHGKRIEDDPRNFLFTEFVRLVGEVQPKFFLMENVRGLLTYSKGKFKQLIEEAFARIGYRVVSTIVCAADYGVPQLRYRVIFIGTRLDGVELSLPQPTHSSHVTVAEALDDLPLLKEDYEKKARAYTSAPSGPFQKYARQGAGSSVSLHFGHPLSPQASRIARYVKPGNGLRSVPTRVLPERFKRMRRVSTGALRRDCTTLYYRLDPNRPAYTITCNYRNIASGPFLHPYEDRSLTHREAARLMSYPDHYEFLGASVPRQIGNSVPPLMAEAFGKHILTLLNQGRRVRRKAA